MNAKQLIAVAGIVGAFIACAQPAPDPSPAPAAECASSRFFALYARGELVRASGPASLVLDVPVNLHSADCGAPDCYGHGMTLTLELRRVGKRCEIVSAKASAVPFNECGIPADEMPRPWTNRFVVKGTPNLADHRLARIELRDSKRHEALLLLPNSYYFYENVKPSSRLRPELEPEDAKGCCYGYTNSAFRPWSFEPQK